jgi:hypothetical protein
MTKHEEIMLSTLKTYIDKMEKVSIYYKGIMDDDAKWVNVSPYLIGENKKGNIVLSAYFYPNDQQKLTGDMDTWKTYLLSNIYLVVPLSETFNNDKIEFNRYDKRMKRIICCIP